VYGNEIHSRITGKLVSFLSLKSAYKMTHIQVFLTELMIYGGNLEQFLAIVNHQDINSACQFRHITML